MDQHSFDRIARLLGGALSRRAGLRALLGAAITLPAVAAPDAVDAASPGNRPHGERQATGGSKGKGDGARKPGVAGPCGNGSRKDNICTRNQDCCTGLCNLKAGDRNRDRKGRCRCSRNGRPCTEDRNCCNAACVNGRCNGSVPPAPPVPSGDPCTTASVCADPNATCTTYQHDEAAGEFCLLPRRALCSSDAQCASGDCAGGVCVACSSNACGRPCNAIVCQSCTYQTVQAAITASAAGDIIDIGEGIYSEDLSIDKDLTLRACKGTQVVLKNATYDTRTITVTNNAKLSLVDITVDAYKNLSANPVKKGGGIASNGDLSLYRESVIQNAGGWNSGGAFSVIPGDGLSAIITITDQSVIRANKAQWEGGGGYAKGEVDVFISENAAIRNNLSDSYDGGMTLLGAIDLVVEDDAVIDGNDAVYAGGGIHVGKPLGVDAQPSTVTIRDRAVISNNVSRQSNGGGLYIESGLYDSRSTLHITGDVRMTGNRAKEGGAAFTCIGFVTTIDGNVEIVGNDQTGTSINASERGGAIEMSRYSSDSTPWPTDAAALTIGGNVRILNNTTAQDGGAIFVYRSTALITDSARISGNIATGNGGGIALSNNSDTSLASTLTVSGQATVSGNSATSGGGVYSIDSGNTLTVTTGTITGNTPDNCAGAGISC
jgi:hypothetical protein